MPSIPHSHASPDHQHQRPLRLLRVISSIDPESGGTAEATRRIDTQLLASGHRPEVVCLDAPDADFIARYPAPVHALGPSSTGYRYNSRLTPWLVQNAPAFDAVIVDGLWQYHGFGTWRALRGTATPYFVFPHGMLDPWFKRAYPLKHLKKWLYWPWAEYRVLRDARAVLFTCEEERQLAQQTFWLYSAQAQVTTLGTADVAGDPAASKAAFLAAHPALAGKRLVLFLGRIHEKKGCDLLVEAFAQVAERDANLQLVMAGPGSPELTASLRRAAEARGIAERITWTGMLQGELKWGALAAAEVFCLPSHQENFGMAIIEAMACGTPVLISDKVNIWREIAADSAGLVAPDTTAGALLNLERWLTMTAAEQAAMRRAARESFARRFRIEEATETLVRILRSSTNSGRTPLVQSAAST